MHNSDRATRATRATCYLHECTNVKHGDQVKKIAKVT